MRITKSQLKRIIKEELRVVLENKVASVEKTDMSGAEAAMDPKYRVHSRRAPGLPGTDDSAGEIYIVTLSNGTKLNATVSDGEVKLFDLKDNPIDNEDLERDVLAVIQSPEQGT
tara:strand:- start:2248 stop:2589 length:342 start_codon:yes stop_codon:yes gene_type:complete